MADEKDFITEAEEFISTPPVALDLPGLAARFDTYQLRVIPNLISGAKRQRATLADKDAALEAMYRATEPIAIADEHDVTTEEGYATINKNTRKAIVAARALIAKAYARLEEYWRYTARA